ncbi:hypothetical protein PVAP13_1NG522500 [Panicum virgatum]|nr:hypothetical protein PVAP13_1NG522500 [Panicum virgatum]KAG2654491.1 hypothetical protein PVAP13_1NG522500 [Panicum virgatum]
MKPPVPTSKSTASMVDDLFVVLDTSSASGSAYTSLGRSANPLEDLEKPANSEGKAAADSLFEEPITFDQAPKSDRLFASEVNGHAKATSYRFQALDEQYYKSWFHMCPALGKPVPFCNL